MNCECPSCNALTPHEANSCGQKPEWYIEAHPVDKCDHQGLWQGVLCQECFDATIEMANAIIKWGLTDARPTATCATCPQPLVRTSNIIRDVARL